MSTSVVNKQTIGTWGNCGGPVTVPLVWHGVNNPTPSCERCGFKRPATLMWAQTELSASQYARDFGLPAGHLHPTHYDILAKAGARMDEFTRAALSTDKGEAK